MTGSKLIVATKVVEAARNVVLERSFTSTDAEHELVQAILAYDQFEIENAK